METKKLQHYREMQKKETYNNRNDTKTDIRLRDVKVGEARFSVCVSVCVCVCACVRMSHADV